MHKFSNKPVLQSLKEAGVEPDQRLRAALSMIGGESVNDAQIFHALYRLNTLLTRRLQLEDKKLFTTFTGAGKPIQPVSTLRFSDDPSFLDPILNRALEVRHQPNTLGTRDFLLGVLEIGLRTGDKWAVRPASIDMLTQAYGPSETTPLSQVPEVTAFLRELQSSIISDEDFQFMIAIEEDRIVFRLASTLADYVESESGVLVPRRALLTHFKERFGGFTQDEIEELEELLNNPKAQEQDFQSFFERHTHFFRKWDLREVYSQVHLRRMDAGDLIPDFILTDREAQKAAIVELKLPRAKLIRRQKNRDRFSSAITEARAQLLAYKRWFQEAENRALIRERVGMEIYEPHLSVIIGRAVEFGTPLDRQTLQSQHSDIEVVTFDDMLRYAKQRRLLIGGRL